MDLVQPAIAHQSSMWHSQVRTLGNNRLLDFHDLSHVITAGTELLGPDPFVDSNQKFMVEVVSLVNPSKIADKIVKFHALKEKRRR